jgi:hypothetical protein
MQVHVTIDGQQYGPYPIKVINEYIAEGRLLFNNTLAWYEGCQEWIQLERVPGVLQPPDELPPPLPTSQSNSEDRDSGFRGESGYSNITKNVVLWAGFVVIFMISIMLLGDERSEVINRPYAFTTTLLFGYFWNKIVEKIFNA